MDLWPPSEPFGGKKKNKDGRSIPGLGLGSNIVSLSEQHGRLEWTSAVQDGTASTERERIQLRVGKPILCFPRTRPPPLQIPVTSVQQRAEQGANFLRTHLPEVDISAELIRDEIALDEGVSLRDQDFNPFQGNLLERVSVGTDENSKSTYLMFPTGEHNRELNMSPISIPPSGSPTFKPSSKPKLIFSSPIQQISARDDSNSSYLAIRTYGPTNFLQVKHSSGTEQPPGVRFLELGHIDRASTGNNLLVDVKALRLGEFILATTTGSVYNCTFTNAKANVNLIHTSEEAPDDFWRVVPSPNSQAVLLVSKSNFEWLDTRSRTSTTIYSHPSKKQAITSASPLSTPHLLSVCTTENVLWIDRRKPMHPLLAYRHGRQRDRTLRLDRFPPDTGHLFLSSQKNDLITIYDIEAVDAKPVSLRTSPYCLPAVNGYNTAYTGRTILPRSGDKLSATMFSLSERGSLYALDLHDPELSDNEYFPTTVEWSEEIQALHLKSDDLRVDIGPRGSQQVMKVDLTGAYDRAFRQHFKATAEAEDKNAESVYDLVEQLPTFWQSNSIPIEHMLTTYDIAFATGDEPEVTSRADFLTGSVVNSHRGYRALIQGRLSSKDLRKNAPWHYDLRNTLERLDSETLGDHVEFERFLHKFDLVRDDERSAASIKLENDAREQLVLDMALASDVYSAHPFAKVGVDDELNALTEALSLGEDVPPVTFKYLRPVNRSNKQDEEEEKESGVLSTSLGAKLLLKEWEVGTNPNDYVYRDPYGDTEETCRPPEVSQRARPTQVAQSQRPPMVIATASLQPPAVIAEPKKLTNKSQGTLPPIRAANSQSNLMNTQTPASQILMASTQVLPGPFGGRPAPGKKAVKKRVGGF